MKTTVYMAAYDTESENCLDAVRRIVKVHERTAMPATFFVVAGLLDSQEAEYRAMLGNHPLFEIASHGYAHMVLRPHPAGAEAGPKEQWPRELIESKHRLEDAFGRPVDGYRTPWGFAEGLRGAPEILAVCQAAGYRYISSLLWGPAYSLPALIEEPFTYAQDGFPALWEIPSCGWHENVLKGHPVLNARPLQLFPHPMPEAMVTDFVKTPEEEFAMHRRFVDKGLAMSASHVTLVWHPWSLGAFDPEMKMLDRMFKYVRERAMPVCTFADYVAGLNRK
jgi:peptidoglycan/xylan/chitin deacetylase (PgdA/CDA1 family)